MYVGNCVQHIRDCSCPGDWFHIPGKENPANEASCSLTAKELLQSNRWFNGPKFRWKQDLFLLQLQPTCALHPSDLEVRKHSASTLVKKIEEDRPSTYTRPLEPDPLNHFSSLNHLKQCIIQVQGAIERLRHNKMYNWHPKKGPCSVKELSQAKNIVLRSIQFNHFKQDIKTLKKLEGNDNQFQDR